MVFDLIIWEFQMQLYVKSCMQISVCKNRKAASKRERPSSTNNAKLLFIFVFQILGLDAKAAGELVGVEGEIYDVKRGVGEAL